MTLDEFFKDWLSAPSPPRPPPTLAAPVDRYWARLPFPVGELKLEWVRPEISDLFPGAETRRAGRSPRSSTRGKQTRVLSHKAGRMVRGASQWEGLHALDADFDPSVASFCEQPLSFRYGRGRKHRPDALVVLVNGSLELREVKPETKAAEDEDRWLEIGTTVAGAGIGYRVVTDRHLKGTARARNIQTFMEDTHADLPDDRVLDELWDWMGTGARTADELAARFPCIDRAAVHSLIRKLFLAVRDLDAAFDGSAPLMRCRRGIRRIGGSFTAAEARDP